MFEENNKYTTNTPFSNSKSLNPKKNNLFNLLQNNNNNNNTENEYNNFSNQNSNINNSSKINQSYDYNQEFLKTQKNDNNKNNSNFLLNNNEDEEENENEINNTTNNSSEDNQFKHKTKGIFGNPRIGGNGIEPCDRGRIQAVESENFLYDRAERIQSVDD